MLGFFALTLFVSATLLFLVQPMVGKMILPRLGGTPAVWNTCMVFFQFVLLVGYAYTHTVSTYQDRRRQLIMHGGLLLLPFLVLPFSMGEWTPPAEHNPIFAVLWLLLGMVGLPFFVVATSAPLLQKWFAATGHKAGKDPYFLYGASNLGSMLALVLYPLVVEPLLGLEGQRYLWMIGYGMLVALVAGCGWVVWQAPAPALATTAPIEAPPVAKPQAAATAIKKDPKAAWRPKRPWYARHYHKSAQAIDAPKPASNPDHLTGWRRLRWVGLAAIPSSLMLGVTTHLTTDIAAIPLIWVIPLALYLLTFILVFARWPVTWTGTPHMVALFVQPLFVMFVVLLAAAKLTFPRWQVPIEFFLHTGSFFFCTLVCHGELAKDRPSARHLTEFYLWMSVGGVLGGLFNTLVAPLIFWFAIIEYPLAMILACLLRPRLLGDVPLIPGDTRAHRITYLGVALDLAIPVFLGVLAYFAVDFGVRTNYRSMFVVFVILLGLLLMLRPVRFGLSVGLILLGAILFERFNPNPQAGGPIIFADRTFFGLVRVRRDEVKHYDQKGNLVSARYFHTLKHGGIDHGQQILSDSLSVRRYPRNYFHPGSGIGQVFQKLSQHTQDGWPDWRLAVSLAGLGAAPGQGVFNQLVDLHSEPPYAIVGLGAGTLACHAKPYQRADFYEIDPLIQKLSQPDHKGEFIFTYVQDARDRGAQVNIILGDGRLTLKNAANIEHFYHVILLDAFSSDAIPVHLLTVEAIDLYLTRLVDGGILAFNTTNRYVDIKGVLADIAKERDLVCWHFGDYGGEDGYGTDWIIMQRRVFGKVPGAFNGGPPLAHRFDERYLPDPDAEENAIRWRVQKPNGNRPWDDGYSNLMSVLRWK